MEVVDVTVRPPWPSEPPRSAGPGGLVRIEGGVARRALRIGDGLALVEAAWRGEDVLLRAHAVSEGAARVALAQMRFVLCLDDDLEPFHRAFRSDPLLGRAIRARPRMRLQRKPVPFEALAWAIIEQLIDTQRAGNIAWAFTRAHGVRHPRGLWVAPLPAAFANAAALEAAGLAPTQARTLSRVARAVDAGRIDPGAADQRALAAIPGVGEWTLAHLNLFGRGMYDVPLAKDVGMRNAYARVAGVRTGSVGEEEFAAVLARYAPWQGLAAMYLVAAGWRSGGRWSESPHDLRRR
jgi:3-methyladenine DNA glycosylase/8-oxoguanine DNA glycosylase